MESQSLPTNEVPAGDRLKRVGQLPEQYIGLTDRPLEQVVKGLSRDLPAAVVILLHSGNRTVAEYQLVNVLNRSTELPVRVIEAEERLQAGRIYVTPPGYSAGIHERTLKLEPIIQARPVVTINKLFESAAIAYHDRVIGVVLTGFWRDGTSGLKAVHDAGGLTMVQDPVEAEYPAMPENAMRDLPATFCLRLAEIGPALDLLARRGTKLETGLSVSVRMLKDRVGLFQRLLAQSTRNVGTRDYLVIELDALQRDLHATQALLYETLRGG